MAATIKFGVWASNTVNYVASDVLAADTDGAVSGEYIYADIFNGILKDVSLVTVSLISALANITTSTASMTFDNSQTLAATTANLQTLLYKHNVESADKWKTARTFTITDYDNSGVGTTAVSVNGSGNVILRMPQAFKGSLAGEAATATKWTSSITVAISDYSGTNTGATSNIQGAENNTIVLKLPEQLNCHYDRITGSSNATHYITAVQSPAAGNHDAKVLAGLSYKPSTNTLYTNISGTADKFNLDSFQNIYYATSTPTANVTISDYYFNVPAIYFVHIDYWVCQYNGDRYVTSTLIFKDNLNEYNMTPPIASATSTGSLIYFRLVFSSRTTSGTHNIVLQYTTTNPSSSSVTWNTCTNEHILNISRIICG